MCLPLYCQRIFSVRLFFRGPEMRQQIKCIHPAEIMRSRMMKNGVQCAAIGRCQVRTFAMRLLVLICHYYLAYRLGCVSG